MIRSGTSVARPVTLRQHFEAFLSWECELASMYIVPCFWLDSLNIHAMLTSSTVWANWPQLSATHLFYPDLPLQLQAFDVGGKCKIYLSACGRYTIDCGIPPIQNTKTDCPEMARCTLSVSCSTDLDYCCFWQSGQCISLTCAQNFKSFLTVYAKLPHHFSVFCLPFGSHSKHHNGCNVHWKSWLITGQLWTQSSWQNFWCSWTFVCIYIKNKSACRYYSQTPFTNNVQEDCSYIKNQL